MYKPQFVTYRRCIIVSPCVAPSSLEENQCIVDYGGALQLLPTLQGLPIHLSTTDSRQHVLQHPTTLSNKVQQKQLKRILAGLHKYVVHSNCTTMLEWAAGGQSLVKILM
jgi:hypothetical protein